ncbi:hypothetical protein IV203_018707 [Nitzschia inconspicua]|uniref:Uncharacterized protein n=1 Tax=Nitzschia inconspicua TaxID=303405 RepID=A0A9K3M2J6_9STRA|nr:hypothetical protein IV203_018707 [Nitzschia inconspicua]
MQLCPLDPNSECRSDVPPPPGRRVGGLSPCNFTKKSSMESNANATWDVEKPKSQMKTLRLRNDLLGVSFHTAKDNLASQEYKRSKSTGNNLNRKQSFLKDDPDVGSLLKMLQTTNFVGEIDPVHHARYIAEPEEEKESIEETGLFDLSEMEKSSISMLTTYNSDDQLLSTIHASKRELCLLSARASLDKATTIADR